MALGRQGDRQSELLVTWAEMPRSPGHVFYDRLQAELVAARVRRVRRGPVRTLLRGAALTPEDGLVAVLLMTVDNQAAVFVVSIQADPFD